MASLLFLALALCATACSDDYTVSYLYVTTEKTLPHGLIDAFQIDYQSGYLYPLADSPIDAGGRNTVGLVLAPNDLFLYTVNNFSSDVVEFAIGTDGKLYTGRSCPDCSGSSSHRRIPPCSPGCRRSGPEPLQGRSPSPPPCG